jgi:hypothetical protein
MRKSSIYFICTGVALLAITSGSAAYKKLPDLQASPLLRVVFNGCLLGNIEPCG